MKVIFLDIDGVLNDQATWGDETWVHGSVLYPGIAEYLVRRLNQIIKATGAVLVLSTSWRAALEIDTYLLARGVQGKIVGRTPRSWECGSDNTRWREIQWWLTPRLARGEITGYVILDDEWDFGLLSKWHVRTNPLTGLSDDDVDRAINILNEMDLAPLQCRHVD